MSSFSGVVVRRRFTARKSRARVDRAVQRPFHSGVSDSENSECEAPPWGILSDPEARSRTPQDALVFDCSSAAIRTPPFATCLWFVGVNVYSGPSLGDRSFRHAAGRHCSPTLTLLAKESAITLMAPSVGCDNLVIKAMRRLATSTNEFQHLDSVFAALRGAQ